MNRLERCSLPGRLAGRLMLFLLTVSLCACASTSMSRDQELRMETAMSPVSRGNPNGQIVIVQYSDFTCTHCKTGAETMQQLIAKYPQDLKLYFKPVSYTKNSPGWIAAKAAFAAGGQGKFWEMHDLLFAKQDLLPTHPFSQLAAQLQLNQKQFEADLSSEILDNQVERETKQAQEMGMKGTPCFFINGQIVNGAYPLAEFSRIVERLKKGGTADTPAKKKAAPARAKKNSRSGG